jgi:hypothetical protein
MAVADGTRSCERRPSAVIRSTGGLCPLWVVSVTVLFWAVLSLVRLDAEIERSFLVAAEDSQCTARSMREQVTEQHP